MRVVLSAIDYEGKDKDAIGTIDDKIVGVGPAFPQRRWKSLAGESFASGSRDCLKCSRRSVSMRFAVGIQSGEPRS